MTQNGPSELDRVFRALGNETRRHILRLLSQGARYPYELHKVLKLTPRAVFKHLEVLQEAGLVEREHGESDVGPDRVYYKLNARFGLSTTIVPDAFVVRVTRTTRGTTSLLPRGFIVPEARPDVAAVRKLLRELGRVNRRLVEIDEERMRFTSLRGKIIRRIEDIMEQSNWDEKSCQEVRSMLDPVRPRDSDPVSAKKLWSETMRKTLQLFETLLARHAPEGCVTNSDDDEEIVVDPE
ncbi:MAG: hypothetical protein DRO87_07210 [Candidatus Thorarchaeota archaeon]|nr:MAG: hypothetical protein DRP09_11320 [Candidatus Thorarchaeota archaeon]RLI57247.1 MAG: hypothetical protein DRO87_07210 [Candidatus Thorarchaeota archaeon]